MGAYLLKRILLMIPTLIGIMLISFTIIQFAPGGPVERVIAQLTGTDVSATARIGGGGGDECAFVFVEQIVELARDGLAGFVEVGGLQDFRGGHEVQFGGRLAAG